MNITYTSGSTYTTSSSHCWSAVYLFSGCSSVSNAVGTSGGFTAEGHNLLVTHKLWESGILLFDAYSRQCAVTSEYYYQADAPPINEPASWPSVDTMVPGNSSLYYISAWGGQRFCERGQAHVQRLPHQRLRYPVNVRSELSSQGIRAGGRGGPVRCGL